MYCWRFVKASLYKGPEILNFEVFLVVSPKKLKNSQVVGAVRRRHYWPLLWPHCTETESNPHTWKPLMGYWTRFTEDILLVIQIRWKLCLAVILFIVIKSQQTFAHAMPAQLPCLVQIYVAITLLKLRQEQNEISIGFELRWKTGLWNGIDLRLKCRTMIVRVWSV